MLEKYLRLFANLRPDKNRTRSNEQRKRGKEGVHLCAIAHSVRECALCA